MSETAPKQAERTYEEMCALANIGTWKFDPKRSHIMWSKEVYKIFEFEESMELSKDIFLTRYSDESSEIIGRAIDLALEKGKSFIRDAEIKTASGKRKWIRTQGKIVQNDDGKSKHLFGTIQDISEIRLLDRVSKESELTLDQVEQITHIGHWSVNIIDGSIYHSDEIKRIFGYEPSEYALSVEEAINAYHPDDRAEVIEHFNRAVETGEGYEFYLRIVQPSGDIRKVHSRGYTEKNDEGKVIRVYGVFQDITEVQQTVELLEQSRMLLNASLESQTDTILLSIDQNYRYLFFNKAHAEAMKSTYSKEILIGTNIFEYITVDEDREAAKKNYERALRGESHSNIREYGEKKAWFESFFNPILNDKNEIVGATAMARDITKRKRSEQALLESRNRYHALFEQAGDGIFTLDTTGKILSINETFARMHGYLEDEMATMSIDTLDVNGNAKMAERINRIMTGETLSFEVEHYHKDGHKIPLLVTANLVSLGTEQFIIAIHRDLTAYKQMEKELLKVQKLDALGLLAGGIAHDFNNLMGGVFGYIDMANEETDNPTVTHYLARATSSIDRARALTQQLLTFAKGGTPIKKRSLLFPFIHETAQFALSGSNVASDFEAPNDLWPCDFDKEQIAQVIDNIVINAKQAMSDGGSIKISATNITIAAGQHPSLKKGDYVKISIKDFGIGIPEEIMPRIFDPFYSTKATGHGLGLATSYSILRRHDGHVDVTSEPGKGSTFHIYLPASNTLAPAPLAREATVHKGRGTFLVMDDEQVIRETIGSMLESLGYTVVFKEDGRTAIDFVLAETKAKRALAGMIFDLTIPGGMGGELAVKEIRKHDPKTPVFVMSGYAVDPVMANANEYGFTASICKPFRRADLSKMLSTFIEPNTA